MNFFNNFVLFCTTMRSLLLIYFIFKNRLTVNCCKNEKKKDAMSDFATTHTIQIFMQNYMKIIAKNFIARTAKEVFSSINYLKLR